MANKYDEHRAAISLTRAFPSTDNAVPRTQKEIMEMSARFDSQMASDARKSAANQLIRSRERAAANREKKQ